MRNEDPKKQVHQQLQALDTRNKAEHQRHADELSRPLLVRLLRSRAEQKRHRAAKAGLHAEFQTLMLRAVELGVPHMTVEFGETDDEGGAVAH